MTGLHTDALPDYEQLIASLIDTLVAQRWAVMPNFLSPALVSALRDELVSHARRDELQSAKIGKGGQHIRRKDIRGDDILWLNGSSEGQQRFLDLMDLLRQGLNRDLYLGLESLECHFAIYTPGTGYQKHLDSFQNNNYRRVTIVAYLNADWQPGDGGELCIYDKDEAVLAMVEPRVGTLVCFMSEDFPHEVVATTAERYSIAGWFKVREPV